jgi:anti-sigma factor RsiW
MSETTCEALGSALIAYHFGACEPAERARVESHLPGCPTCVREWVALKREVELSEHAPVPSGASRRSLREEMARTLHGPARPARWWERPFAAGIAGAAVATAVLMVHALSVSPGVAPRSLRTSAVQVRTEAAPAR